MKLILYTLYWYFIAFYSFIYFKVKAIKDFFINILTIIVLGSNEEYSESDYIDY